MNIWKAIITVAALAVLFLFGSEAFHLQKERISIAKEYEYVQQEYNDLLMDNQKIKERIEYLSEPRNLEKELRSKFNYIHPGEKLIIVIPEEEETEEE